MDNFKDKVVAVYRFGELRQLNSLLLGPRNPVRRSVSLA